MPRNNFMHEAEQKLIELAFKHAPLQQFEDHSDVDGRYVTVSDPPGAYYLLGIDCPGCDKLGLQYEIQLMFWGIDPTDVDVICEALGGWTVVENGELPVLPEGVETKMMHFIIEAPKAWIVEPPLRKVA